MDFSNMNKFVIFLRSPRCYRLQDILVFTALGVPLLLVFTGQFLFKGTEPITTVLSQVSLSLMLFLAGCVGIVAVIRKEFRQVLKYHGREAQIMGLILWIAAWSSLGYVLTWIFVLSKH